MVRFICAWKYGLARLKLALKKLWPTRRSKFDIAAPAVKGKANQELIKFLAKQLETVVGNIKIISGAGERIKLIKICQK